MYISTWIVISVVRSFKTYKDNMTEKQSLEFV